MQTLRAIRRSKRVLALSAAIAFVAVNTVSVGHAVAQSTGPEHTGYDPTAPLGGHYHEGALGDQWLLIERNLKCNCGCGLDTHSCQFQMQCGTSPGWSDRIRRELEAARTPDEVEAGFVADYGTQVLMAPPPEGFNLLGYFLPAATILAAGALIVVVARGNMKRNPVPVRPVSDEDAERLRAEWQKLDEAESPDW